MPSNHSSEYMCSVPCPSLVRQQQAEQGFSSRTGCHTLLCMQGPPGALPAGRCCCPGQAPVALLVGAGLPQDAPGVLQMPCPGGASAALAGEGCWCQQHLSWLQLWQHLPAGCCWYGWQQELVQKMAACLAIPVGRQAGMRRVQTRTFGVPALLPALVHTHFSTMQSCDALLCACRLCHCCEQAGCTDQRLGCRSHSCEAAPEHHG